MEGKRTYSTADVAQRLGVSQQTVQRWVDQGRLMAWKTPGGHRRIDADDADRVFGEAGVLTSRGTTKASPRPAVSRVLVVDDNDVERAVLAEAAAHALPGCEVHPARNGFEALVLVGRLLPDWVLTDLRMPHMDGAEMVRELVRLPLRPVPRIVVVSALEPTDVAAMGALPPEVRVLRKPLSTARLTEILAGPP